MSTPLRELVVRIERKEVRSAIAIRWSPRRWRTRSSTGRPYTFPRRCAPRGASQPRDHRCVEGFRSKARDLAALDPDAIARVRGEATPDPRDLDELHDLLISMVVTRPVAAWSEWFASLVERGRALTVTHDFQAFWCAAERLPGVERLWPGVALEPSSFALPPWAGGSGAGTGRHCHTRYSAGTSRSVAR